MINSEVTKDKSKFIKICYLVWKFSILHTHTHTHPHTLPPPHLPTHPQMKIHIFGLKYTDHNMYVVKGIFPDVEWGGGALTKFSKFEFLHIFEALL